MAVYGLGRQQVFAIMVHHHYMIGLVDSTDRTNGNTPMNLMVYLLSSDLLWLAAPFWTVRLSCCLGP